MSDDAEFPVRVEMPYFRLHSPIFSVNIRRTIK